MTGYMALLHAPIRFCRLKIGSSRLVVVLYTPEFSSLTEVADFVIRRWKLWLTSHTPLPLGQGNKRMKKTSGRSNTYFCVNPGLNGFLGCQFLWNWWQSWLTNRIPCIWRCPKYDQKCLEIPPLLLLLFITPRFRNYLPPSLNAFFWTNTLTHKPYPLVHLFAKIAKYMTQTSWWDPLIYLLLLLHHLNIR